MSLSPEQQQALDQMPAPDALLYLAGIHGGGKAGAIGEIAAACDFGQAESAASECVARVAATCPELSQFPEGVNGPAILSAVATLSSASSTLHALIPQD